jgi:hypothetical protein
LHGHILHELQEIIERPEETDHLLLLGLHRFAITEFPSCVHWHPPWPPTTAPPNSTASSICCCPA